MEALKEWSEDGSEMAKIHQKVSTFVVQLVLDGDIPQEVYMQATTSPMTLANAMKKALIGALTPKEVTDEEVMAHDNEHAEEALSDDSLLDAVFDRR